MMDWGWPFGIENNVIERIASLHEKIDVFTFGSTSHYFKATDIFISIDEDYHL